MWSKNGGNNLFDHPFQTVGGKSSPKSFQAFGQIVGPPPQKDQILTKSSISQEGPQISQQNTNLIDMNEARQQSNTVYSTISDVTKQVYDSLNSTVQEDKKVQLMNFFDDDE